jgi:hypothetical protein
MISIKPVSLNPYFSIRDNLDPDSNITEKSDLHSEKQLSPKTSTDAGTIISTKPVLANIVWSISLCAGLRYFKSNDQTGIYCRSVVGAHENIAISNLYLLSFSERFVSAGQTDI